MQDSGVRQLSDLQRRSTGSQSTQHRFELQQPLGALLGWGKLFRTLYQISVACQCRTVTGTSDRVPKDYDNNVKFRARLRTPFLRTAFSPKQRSHQGGNRIWSVRSAFVSLRFKRCKPPVFKTTIGFWELRTRRGRGLRNLNFTTPGFGMSNIENPLLGKRIYNLNSLFDLTPDLSKHPEVSRCGLTFPIGPVSGHRSWLLDINPPHGGRAMVREVLAMASHGGIHRLLYSKYCSYNVNPRPRQCRH